MRRAAMGADQGPNWEAQSGGGFPFDTILREMAGDEIDPTNISFAFRRRIRDDHMIAMGLHFIDMPIVQARWFIEADSARAASFVDNLIRPIFAELVFTILRFLWSGYSPAAKLFEVINPTWFYFENGQRKEVWDNGNVGALVYRRIQPLRPELCRPNWTATGRFNGIKYDQRYGAGAFLVDGERKQDIDLTHSIWAVHGQQGEDNSIWGKPRVAHAAPIFHMFWWVWALLGRAMENNADPGPTMRYPRDSSNAPTTQTVDGDGAVKKNVDIALDIGRYKRDGSTVALPSDQYRDGLDKPSGHYLWDMKYDKPETNFEIMMSVLNYLEAAKLRALWQPEQSAIEGSGSSSSRNVASEFGNLRDESQGVLFQQVADLIINVLAKPALAMNMPDYEGTVKMKALGFGKQYEQALAQFFQLIGQEDWRAFGVDAPRIAETVGFPLLDPIERERTIKEARDRATAASKNGSTPVVTPTQGRRALVTQTGFGETVYVQLGSRIDLSSDGDFVTSLPRTDHFADRGVVGIARGLFTNLRDHLVAIEAAGKDMQMDVVGLAMTTENFLARAFDRVVGLTAKRAISSERPKRSDHEDWIREVCAEVVDRVLAADGPDAAGDIARAAVADVFNYATLVTAEAAGIKLVQIVDGSRDGEFLSMSEALTESIGASSYRLIKVAGMKVIEAPLEGALARYDPDSESILIDPSVDSDERRAYCISVGQHYAL